MAKLRLASAWSVSTVLQGLDFRSTLRKTKLFYKAREAYPTGLIVSNAIVKMEFIASYRNFNIFNTFQYISLKT